MKINELIKKLEEDKDYANQRIDHYQELIARGDNHRQTAIWLSYLIEFEARSNTLYGVLYQLKQLEEG